MIRDEELLLVEPLQREDAAEIRAGRIPERAARELGSKRTSTDTYLAVPSALLGLLCVGVAIAITIMFGDAWISDSADSRFGTRMAIIAVTFLVGVVFCGIGYYHGMGRRVRVDRDLRSGRLCLVEGSVDVTWGRLDFIIYVGDEEFDCHDYELGEALRKGAFCRAYFVEPGQHLLAIEHVQ
jgi:hypothetical protein